MSPAADQDARASFLSHYKKHYEKLIDNYTNIEYSYIDTDLSSKPVQVAKVEGKYKADHYTGGQQRFRSEKEARDNTQFNPSTIEVSNTKYTFQLRRTKARGDYVLSDLKILPSGGRAQFYPVMSPIADTWYNRTFLEIASDPDTTVPSVTDRVFHGVAATELSVVSQEYHPQTKKKVKATKKYYFLPERGWVCIGSLEDLGEPGEVTTVEMYYEYDGDKMYPPLKRVERTLRERNRSEVRRRQEPDRACRIATLTP